MRKCQFSLRTLLIFVAIVTGVCGALTWINGLISQSQRAAWLAAQHRELCEIGASFVEKKESLPMILEIDLSTTSVDHVWLQKRLNHWEYSSINKIRTRKGQLEHSILGELKAKYPYIEFEEVGKNAQERKPQVSVKQ